MIVLPYLDSYLRFGLEDFVPISPIDLAAAIKVYFQSLSSLTLAFPGGIVRDRAGDQELPFLVFSVSSGGGSLVTDEEDHNSIRVKFVSYGIDGDEVAELKKKVHEAFRGKNFKSRSGITTNFVRSNREERQEPRYFRGTTLLFSSTLVYTADEQDFIGSTSQ